MADAPQRPLPKLTELDTQAFWEATSNQQLTYQRCADCDTLVFYPRRHCTNCLGNNLETHQASGNGTVYTFSTVNTVSPTTPSA